jgi:hypothetical protein
MERELTDVVS